MTDHLAVLEEVVADIRAHCNPPNPESDDEVSAAYALAWADRIVAAIALMREQSEVSRLLAEYKREYDNPAPDYTYRHLLRSRLFEAMKQEPAE